MTDFDEKRIDVISQNWNDGLHYGKYYVVQSVSGSTWFIYRGDKKVTCVILGMFKTGGECLAFANKLCDLLNKDAVENLA